jgi:hypothetical protein
MVHACGPIERTYTTTFLNEAMKQGPVISARKLNLKA